MTNTLLYLLSFLLPMLMVPVVLPSVALMAKKKRMVDAPNSRKLQAAPVFVMGGMVFLPVLCITLMVANIFHNIDILFPAVCVIVVLFSLGILDDGIGLNWRIKLLVQTLVVLLLFLCGGYRIQTLEGLFGVYELPYWVSLILSLFIGLMFINAFNFIDGVDGLASALGIFSGIVLGVWDVRHVYIEHAVLSFAVSGALFSFFFFNVFSERYKMYLGDSGSLVLGIFAYISICSTAHAVPDLSFLADQYAVSFFIAIFSVVLFDLARVVLMRILKGRSPFMPDRRHIHHLMVDLGCSHLMATLLILITNACVILVWYLTAKSGMNVEMQFFIVFVSAALLVWGPCAALELLRARKPRLYVRMSSRVCRLAAKTNRFHGAIRRFVDRDRRK